MLVLRQGVRHGALLQKQNRVNYSKTSFRSVSSLRQSRTLRSHWFENLSPWRKPEDVAEILQKNVLFEDASIVAFDKPVGLPMHSRRLTEQNEDYDPASLDLSVNSALPILAETYKGELSSIYSQHRLHSGIIVMAKTEKAKGLYSKYFKNVKVNKTKHQKLCAITIGIPSEVENCAAYMSKKEFEKRKIPVLCDAPGKNKRHQRGETMSAMLDVRVLDSVRDAYDMALVEIHTSATKWDLLPVYLVESLCPILGECTHAARIKTVMDRPMLLGPETTYEEPYILPTSIAEILGVLPSHKVPVHLHCTELTLPDLSKHKKKLVITSSVPGYFLQTLKRLNLRMPVSKT